MKGSLLPAILVCVIFTVCDARSNERFELIYNVTTVDGFGPIIYISCKFVPLPGERCLDLRWLRAWYSGSLFTSQERLAAHGVLVDKAPTRFTLDTVGDNTEVISIRNALKEDTLGSHRYARLKCYVTYSYGENISVSSREIQIPTDKYLPALHHPVCNINTLAVCSGSEVEFTCSSGDSNPEVNLQLRLLRPDGSIRQLGTTNVTTSVFSEDNNAKFTCEMTSDVFPTANRSCSAGPLTILPKITGEAITPSSVTTSAVAPLAVVAFLAILTNIYLLTKNYKLKMKYLAAKNKKSISNDLTRNDDPYMELQKTQVASETQGYMDLANTPEENPGSKISGYENMKEGKRDSLACDNPYESVE